MKNNINFISINNNKNNNYNTKKSINDTFNYNRGNKKIIIKENNIALGAKVNLW